MTVKENQFSLKTLLWMITITGLLIAVFWTIFQAQRTRARMESQIATLEAKAADLSFRLRGEQGQGLRSAYAEKMLYHVLAHSDQYPELVTALKNGSKRNVGMSLHPLGEEDNRTYANFYSMNDPPGATPFCFSFLLREEPYEVLDHISGEQSRLPRKKGPNGQEGDWFCGAGEGGSDVWYRIADDQFTRYTP
ncbi:MAG: hypothetical protein AAFU85_07665 [Planctomycetota bacterium]